ncbi:LarC family nickel insertion protein [Acuticoccus sediminis]|uniref:LarC family nickel insertion protein n=2 Tax=Acuticoccus sediminis TaxID=2184697 RepID=A0A8B2NYV0_9HYPH|nr:LarC family nickel insertion protein [Acuticoccus sediminis]
MFVAAMLSARPELTERVMADVHAVLPPDAAAMLTEGSSGALSGYRFGLERTSLADRPVSYGAFRTMIGDARLAQGTRLAALDIMERLGWAEAAIHRVPLDDVHFHEIADWDTLMDVVAAGSISAALAATWSIAALPLGGGLVRTAHGLLPVPAPATTMILTGYDWRDDGVPGERVTPTGAAIVAHLTAGAGSGARRGGRLAAMGTGLGTRELEGVPNVLRVTVFETDGPRSERTEMMTFEVDDMTGEEIATAADLLRKVQGVRDIVLVPAFGKKGRPVTRVELQADPAAGDRVRDAVFSQTSTLGVRRQEMRRDILPRAKGLEKGQSVKHAVRPGGVVTTKVEQDELTAETLQARRRAAHEAEQ